MCNVPCRRHHVPMVATRPDLATAVGVLSQFASDPCPTHWQALKRVLRYLQATPTHGLEFTRGSCNNICGYSDADWAGDIESRRSTSGYVFMMNGGCISWRSKKQRTVALSSTEAEYMALSEKQRKKQCGLRCSCASSAKCMRQSDQDLRRQSRIHRFSQEPGVSQAHQAHRHPLPFCAREGRSRRSAFGVLSDTRYVGRHDDETNRCCPVRSTSGQTRDPRHHS